MIWRSSFNSKIAKIADFFTVFLSLLISYAVWDYLYLRTPKTFPAPFRISEQLFMWAVVISFYYVILLKSYGAYSYQRFTSLMKEYVNIFNASFVVLLSAIIISYIFYYRIPRTAIILPFFFIIVLMILEKSLLYMAANFIRQKGKNRKQIIIIGDGAPAKFFIDAVNKNFSWGLDIIGLVTADKEHIGKNFYGYNVLGYYENISSIVKNSVPDELIITVSTRNFGIIRYILEFCEIEGMQVRLVSDFFSKVTKKLQYDEIYGLRILSFNMVHTNEMQFFIKRVIDILGSIIAIFLFSPFMLMAALGIWISNGRPILYTLNVVGFNKKPLKTWKFRTMVKNADELKKELENKNEMKGPVFKIKDDPRIIPFGKWLRKFSIDETPQLFSVLKGDLSLVGPRAAGPHELAKYEDKQRRRLSVKPGLTCLWQISGRNEITDFNEWVKLDLEYIDNWSIWLDIKILLKTIPSVIFGRGAS